METTAPHSTSEAAAITEAVASANRDEHATTVSEALRRYPTAIFWAIAMSFTIGNKILYLEK